MSDDVNARLRALAESLKQAPTAEVFKQHAPKRKIKAFFSPRQWLRRKRAMRQQKISRRINRP